MCILTSYGISACDIDSVAVESLPEGIAKDSVKQDTKYSSSVWNSFEIENLGLDTPFQYWY